MPKFKLHAPGKWGEKAVREYSYSMVLEVAGRLEFSGPGGLKHPAFQCMRLSGRSTI